MRNRGGPVAGRISDLSEDPNNLNSSLKLDPARLSQIENQLIKLRQQLFEAKDQVLDALTESMGRQLREVQKTFKNDLVLKSKLGELTSQQALEFILNKSLKVLK